MPDPVVHASFGREVLSSLPAEIQDTIRPDPYTFALFGPDVWFLYKPLKHLARGRAMHTTKTGSFLMALLRQAAASSAREEMFSYLAGFLCHYALDSTTHPYIISRTALEHVFPRSHMSLEHALDAVVMRRDGYWGQKHPVTSHYFPRVRLPESIREDVDRVFEQVYGWQHCWADMNRSYQRYRACFRLMEPPRGLAVGMTRLTGKDVLKSVTYARSHFHNLDPENSAHRTWVNPYEPDQQSSESFPEMRSRALSAAVGMIRAVYDFLFNGTETEESVAAVIGNRSYLSGLPWEDPRNLRVKSLLPPGADETEAP